MRISTSTSSSSSSYYYYYLTRLRVFNTQRSLSDSNIYNIYKEMKEAVTKVTDTFTQEDFRGAFQKLLERYNKCNAIRRRLLRRGLEFHVCTINKSAHSQKNLENYLMILVWYYSFTAPSWPLVSWLPHVSTGLSLFLSTPTLLSDPRKWFRNQTRCHCIRHFDTA